MSQVEETVSQLKSLIGKQVISAHEKWQLLEQRDKIMRKYRAKISDVNQAAIFQGTCPDMCPEKERYRREVQIFLHSYEVDEFGSVNHVRAVKDYARSSADQEEPLSHELRPVSVLEKTMHYLISQIMAHEPMERSQLPVWYDFLWNRTRAIRKDITQQMLNDFTAIDLIEKCARFHIYAAYRLCEVDIASFDQRMNTENLRKSLLSLRHMYDDSNKSGVSCPNESEFRCYDLLLNLNDSNIFRQALIYKQAVRQSEPIKFALRLCSAMQNNNFVSFFRSIRLKASFLQACLIHRYFNDVRSEALRIMLKSYRALNPQAATQLPLGDLVNLLHFEDENEASSFFSNFGLNCTTHETYGGRSNCLSLNKNLFVEPDAPPPLCYSSILIDNKRSASTAEIINGSAIEPFIFIDPVISFDSDNRYTNDIVVQNFLNSVQFDLPIDRMGNFSGSPVVSRTNQMDDVERIIMAENITNEIADELINAAVIEFTRAASCAATVQKVSECCVSDLIENSIRGVASEAFNRATQMHVEELKKKQRLSTFLDELALNLSNKLIETTCTDCLCEISENQFQISRTHWLADMKKCVDEFSLETRESLLEQFLSSEIHQICGKIYKTQVLRVIDGLNCVKHNLNFLNVKKCCKHWLQVTRRHTKVRKIFEDFPLSAGRLTDRDFFVPSKRIRLNHSTCGGSAFTENSISSAKNNFRVDPQKFYPSPSSEPSGGLDFTQNPVEHTDIEELDKLLKKFQRRLSVERSLIDKNLAEFSS